MLRGDAADWISDRHCFFSSGPTHWRMRFDFVSRLYELTDSPFFRSFGLLFFLSFMIMRSMFGMLFVLGFRSVRHNRLLSYQEMNNLLD
jgi:hypothetical protein